MTIKYFVLTATLSAVYFQTNVMWGMENEGGCQGNKIRWRAMPTVGEIGDIHRIFDEEEKKHTDDGSSDDDSSGRFNDDPNMTILNPPLNPLYDPKNNPKIITIDRNTPLNEPLKPYFDTKNDTTNQSNNNQNEKPNKPSQNNSSLISTTNIVIVTGVVAAAGFLYFGASYISKGARTVRSWLNRESSSKEPV